MAIMEEKSMVILLARMKRRYIFIASNLMDQLSVLFNHLRLSPFSKLLRLHNKVKFKKLAIIQPLKKITNGGFSMKKLTLSRAVLNYHFIAV